MVGLLRVGVLPNLEQKRSDMLKSGKIALHIFPVVETSGASC